MNDLTESEIAAGRRLGLNEVAVSVARRSGMSLSEMAASLRSLRETGELPNRGVAVAARTKGKGIQVLSEEADRQEGNLKDTGVQVGDLVDRAASALSRYKSNPKDKDAWLLLAEAGALISIMLDSEAPAFADRKGAVMRQPAV